MRSASSAFSSEACACRDPSVGDRFVDLLLLRCDERLDEAGDALALLLGDLGERLVLERRRGAPPRSSRGTQAAVARISKWP